MVTPQSLAELISTTLMHLSRHPLPGTGNALPPSFIPPTGNLVMDATMSSLSGAGKVASPTFVESTNDSGRDVITSRPRGTDTVKSCPSAESTGFARTNMSTPSLLAANSDTSSSSAGPTSFATPSMWTPSHPAANSGASPSSAGPTSLAGPNALTPSNFSHSTNSFGNVDMMPPGPGSIPAIASTGGGVTFAGTGTGTIVFDRPTDPTQTLHWESNLQELEEPFSIPDIRNGAQPNQHPNLPLAAPQPPQQMADPSVAHAVQDNKKSRTKARTIRTTQTGPELLKKTASDFLEGHPLATFVCPLETCSVELPAYSTLSTLWEHCDDSHHQVGLYAQEHYPCEIGCNIGFTDPGHRMDHYAKAKCFSGQISSTQCPEPECSWTPSLHKPESFRRGQVLSHYTEAHAPHAYHQDGYFKDDICQLGFVNNVDLYFHCFGGITARSKFRSSASNATGAHLTGVINGFPTLSNIVTHQ
jgi:hypothetical protein